MYRLLSTKYILGPNGRELMLWNHRLNHYTFKNLIRLYKRGIITNNLRKEMDILPFLFFLFGKSYEMPWRINVKK